jgi:polyferredoxin
MESGKRRLRMAPFRIGAQAGFMFIAVLGIVGIGMTGIIYPYFFCPASPAACAGCPVWVVEHGVLELLSGTGSGVLMFLYLGAMFLIIGAIFGRAFCGLACPVGAFQDAYSFLRRKLSSARSMALFGALALAMLLIGSIWPDIARGMDLDLLSYMWAGYVGAAGAFFLGLAGVMLVVRRKGIVRPLSFIAVGAAIVGVRFFSGALGVEDTVLGSPELMGTLALMAVMVGMVGLAKRFVGRSPRAMEPGRPLERRARLIKYGVLIGVPITTIIFDTLAFTDIDPIGGITATIPQLFLDPSGWSANQFFWFKASFTVAVLGMIAVVDRAWCRYLCPVGAMYAPANQFSATDIRFDAKACIHCQRCIGVCPMAINPKEDKRDPECIRCLRCVDACPVKAQRPTAFNIRKRSDAHAEGQ